MAIFHSYVKLPEGINILGHPIDSQTNPDGSAPCADMQKYKGLVLEGQSDRAQIDEWNAQTAYTCTSINVKLGFEFTLENQKIFSGARNRGEELLFPKGDLVDAHPPVSGYPRLEPPINWV